MDKVLFNVGDVVEWAIPEYGPKLAPWLANNGYRTTLMVITEVKYNGAVVVRYHDKKRNITHSNGMYATWAPEHFRKADLFKLAVLDALQTESK